MSEEIKVRTGLEILIDWANNEDGWVRSIASEVVATRRALTDASIEAAYQVFLTEKGLGDGPALAVPLLSMAVAGVEAADDLRLTRLSALTGVNALSAGQVVDFNPKLTVLFGENAAGKTGYVRVLKQVASVRGASPIIGNIRQPGAELGAKLEFSTGGVPRILAWKGEAGVPPLTRMSVFDSSVVSIHVDDDLTYVFTPGELALFQYVHQAVEAVKGRLERAKTVADAKATSPFVHRFVRDAVLYPKIETLGASTSIVELEKLAVVGPDEQAKLGTLRERVEALQPGALDARLRTAVSDRDLYNDVLKLMTAARDVDWEGYHRGLQAVAAAKERYRLASETAFADVEVPGLLTDPWKAFIMTADAYRKAVEAPVHAEMGHECLYCRQELSEQAALLVTKYNEYCNSSLKQALEAAEQELRGLSALFLSIRLASVREACERRIASYAEGAAIPPVMAAAIKALSEVEAARTAVAAGAPVSNLTALRPVVEESAQSADTAIKSAEEVIAQLGKQAEDRRRDLDAAVAAKTLLENRLVLSTLIRDITDYVARAAWANRAAPLLTRMTAILRGLTEQSKVASKELLDKDFERKFRAECIALRAPDVQLDFAGRRGQAARKKTLTAEHRLSDILSEGEQKVIALADFLAEASLHRTVAPIVFDDPVNSLDHRRIREIASRIVALAQARQVVIFTHNILLVMELVSLCEHAPADFTYYSVEELDGNVGVVTAGARPRLDSISDLGGKINRYIQDAATQAGETRSALVEKAYEVLRAWIEVVVEQDLLANVTKRYDPHVAVLSLARIKTDRLPDATAVVSPLYEKVCRYIASHSQPAETLGVRPSLDDLRIDWQAAQDARKKYMVK